MTARLALLGASDTGATVFGGVTPPPAEDVQIWRLKNRGRPRPFPMSPGSFGHARDAHRAGTPAEAGRAGPRAGPGRNGTVPVEPARASTPPRPSSLVGRGRRCRRDRLGVHRGRADRAPGRAPVDHGDWFTALEGRPATRRWAPRRPSRSTRTTTASSTRSSATRLRRRRRRAGVPAGAHHARQPRRRLRRADDADTPLPTEASVARSLWEHRRRRDQRRLRVPDAPERAAVPTGRSVRAPELDLRARAARDAAHDGDGRAGREPEQPHAAVPRRVRPRRTRTSSASARWGRRRSASTSRTTAPWVDCCTGGENVLSTFVRAGAVRPRTPSRRASGRRRAPDEGFTSGWALWSGTSFAAPKVAAAIARLVTRRARRRSRPGTKLKADRRRRHRSAMGVALPGLPPCERQRSPISSAAAAAGDQGAWEAIVDRFSGLVWATARAHRLSRPTPRTSRRRRGSGSSSTSTASATRRRSAAGWRRRPAASRLRLIRLRAAERRATSPTSSSAAGRGARRGCSDRERDARLWRAFAHAQRALPGAAAAAARRRGAELRGDRRRARHADRRDRPDPRCAAWTGCARRRARGAGMSVSDDRDERLADELRALVAPSTPCPAEVEAFAKAALGWRRLDADLAELLSDSALEAEALAGVRGGGRHALAHVRGGRPRDRSRGSPTRRAARAPRPARAAGERDGRGSGDDGTAPRRPRRTTSAASALELAEGRPVPAASSPPAPARGRDELADRLTVSRCASSARISRQSDMPLGRRTEVSVPLVPRSQPGGLPRGGRAARTAAASGTSIAAPTSRPGRADRGTAAVAPTAP